MKYRKEKDSLGTIEVPEDAYFGASTQRAVNNFPVSGLRFHSSFIYSLALIKQCAAIVNHELGLLDKKVSEPIVTSAKEIMQGKLDDQFVVDVFQTGSGTSTNMNVNEVIASRANEIVTGHKGGKFPVHPNDHVNLGQSSNDVIPSAIHISALTCPMYPSIMQPVFMGDQIKIKFNFSTLTYNLNNWLIPICIRFNNRDISFTKF